MDNKTPETNSSQDNLQIPENWMFPERDSPALKVRQIDLDKRFIAFDLSKDSHDIFTKPQYCDYFFDNEGTSLVKRLYLEEGEMGIPSTYIDLVSDQEISYRIDGKSENFYDKGVRIRHEIGVSVFFKDKSLVGEKDTLLSNYLGGVYYQGRGLETIDFDYNYSTDPNRRKRLYVPSMDFDLVMGLDLVLDPKIRRNEDLFLEEFGNLQPQRDQNGAFYLDKNGDKILLVDWKIEEDELDPSKGLFAVVSQTLRF